MLPFSIINFYGNDLNAGKIYINQLSSSSNHNMLTYSNGELYTRGISTSYNLGTGSDDSVLDGSWSLVNTDVLGAWAGFAASICAKSDGTWWHVGSIRVFGNAIGSNKEWTDCTTIFTDAGIEFNNVKKIQIGYYSMFVLTTDGTLYGMGYNAYGELNNGGVSSYRSLTVCATNVTDVSHTYYALLWISDGVVYRCGYNSAGVVGDGYSVKSAQAIDGVAGFTPVQVQVGQATSFILYNSLTDSSITKVRSSGGSQWGDNGRAMEQYTSYGDILEPPSSTVMSLNDDGCTTTATTMKSTGGLFGVGNNNFNATGALSNRTDNNGVPFCFSWQINVDSPSTDMSKIKFLANMANQQTVCVYNNKVFYSGYQNYIGKSGDYVGWQQIQTPYNYDQ